MLKHLVLVYYKISGKVCFSFTGESVLSYLTIDQKEWNHKNIDTQIIQHRMYRVVFHWHISVDAL